MKNETNQFSAPVPTGVLFIVGGHEDKGNQGEDKDGATKPLEVLKAFVALIGKENPVVEVVTTGSEDGDAYFQDYQTAFSKLGVSQLGHLHHDTRIQILKDEAENAIVDGEGS